MNFDVVGFDWDDGNRAKCAKHGLSIADIESIFQSELAVDSDVGHSTTETRWRAVGKLTAGMFVVFTFRDRDGQVLVRPISAPVHAREGGSSL